VLNLKSWSVCQTSCRFCVRLTAKYTSIYWKEIAAVSRCRSLAIEDAHKPGGDGAWLPTNRAIMLKRGKPCVFQDDLHSLLTLLSHSVYLGGGLSCLRSPRIWREVSEERFCRVNDAWSCQGKRPMALDFMAGVA